MSSVLLGDILAAAAILLGLAGAAAAGARAPKPARIPVRPQDRPRNPRGREDGRSSRR